MVKSARAAEREPPPVPPVWPEIYLTFIERAMTPASSSGGAASAWLWPLQYWARCAAAWSSAYSALAGAASQDSTPARAKDLTDEAIAAHILD